MREYIKCVNSKPRRKMKQSRFHQFNQSQKGKNKNNEKVWKAQNHLTGVSLRNHNNVLSRLIKRQRLTEWVKNLKSRYIFLHEKFLHEKFCLHEKFLTKWQRNVENKEKYKEILANKSGIVILISGRVEFR